MSRTSHRKSSELQHNAVPNMCSGSRVNSSLRSRISSGTSERLYQHSNSNRSHSGKLAANRLKGKVQDYSSAFWIAGGRAPVFYGTVAGSSGRGG